MKTQYQSIKGSLYKSRFPHVVPHILPHYFRRTIGNQPGTSLAGLFCLDNHRFSLSISIRFKIINLVQKLTLPFHNLNSLSFSSP